MTDKYLDQMRQLVSDMRASLDVAHIAIELPPAKDDPAHAHAQAKERAFKELQRLSEAVELLAAELGDVPAPVRH
ncbi:hypothetical protein [Pseudomonas sp. BC115LW]|uniref:hypothetical protein n=1 Tax=Pseudomonas sp. BC115LW TaxID=2683267 RepID=UPI001411B2D2|nr:hypothetical protein [Pseudomonas sp. BC115LW]NBB33763.1 hypothetical protein [Pseudomonas sp. BC115LW]